MDSQAHVPAGVQVIGDYKLLVKILAGFQDGHGGHGPPFLVQLGGTCRGFRRAAAPLVDQRTIEHLVARVPTWQWVDFSISASDGPVGPVGPVGPAGPDHEPDSGPEESTIASRVRAVVRAQAPRWWVACPFRFHGLDSYDIMRASGAMTDLGHAFRVLDQAEALKYNLELHKGPNDLYLRLLNTKRKQVRPQTVESVEKLRELLLDPEDPANLEKYGVPEAYDIRDLKSLTHLKFVRDTDVTFWDTSHVTDMSYMAYELHVKLTAIEHWNTSRVTNMEGAFSHTGFNQDIGRWDTTRVTNMRYMFAWSGFNQDIGRWGTSSVRRMSGMFKYAIAFNQDIGKWDVGQVSIMDRMFSGASAFDHDISAWAAGSVVVADDMLQFCPIREAHMPPTGLTVRGPRATELRPELTHIMNKLGLRYMSFVCVDTSSGASGPLRVSLNRTMLSAPGNLRSIVPNAARERRELVQDQLLRCICTGAMGSDERPRPIAVQFNWTAPLDRPRGRARGLGLAAARHIAVRAPSHDSCALTPLGAARLHACCAPIQHSLFFFAVQEEERGHR